MRNQKFRMVVGLSLLVWSFFARPIYDYVWIVSERIYDKTVESMFNGSVTQSRKAIVDANSVTATEICDYLLRLRHSDDGKAQDPSYLRNILKDSLRFPPPELGVVPKVVGDELIGEDDLATYRRFSIPVLVGVNSVGLYILPKKRVEGKKIPLIIFAHGRGGMPDDTASHQIQILNTSNRDGIRWALDDGYAVWAPIFVFYGEGMPDNLRERLTTRAQEAGTTLPAIEIAKTIKAIDVLSSRPEIDANRIAMVGHSYGGFNALLTTALDSRIKIAVVSAYLNDREAVLDSSEPNGFLDWRFVASLSHLRDSSIASLVCPRPLLVIAGTQDQLFPIGGARKASKEVQEIYQQNGALNAFEFYEFVGRHDFNAKEASRFVKNIFGVNEVSK